MEDSLRDPQYPTTSRYLGHPFCSDAYRRSEPRAERCEDDCFYGLITRSVPSLLIN